MKNDVFGLLVGLQSLQQQDFGRGCGEDCRGAAEQQVDYLGVNCSPPRVACCCGLCAVRCWVEGGGLCE